MIVSKSHRHSVGSKATDRRLKITFGYIGRFVTTSGKAGQKIKNAESHLSSDITDCISSGKEISQSSSNQVTEQRNNEARNNPSKDVRIHNRYNILSKLSSSQLKLHIQNQETVTHTFSGKKKKKGR